MLRVILVVQCIKFKLVILYLVTFENSSNCQIKNLEKVSRYNYRTYCMALMQAVKIKHSSEKDDDPAKQVVFYRKLFTRSKLPEAIPREELRVYPLSYC